MLTVKIIDEDGTQFVKSDVKTVSFNPPTEFKQATLFIWYKEENPETILSGKCYVMNENGKTIADYYILREPSKEVLLEKE